MTTIREAFLRMQAGQIDADTFIAIVEQEMMAMCVVTPEMALEALKMPRLQLLSLTFERDGDATKTIVNWRNNNIHTYLTNTLQKRARGDVK